MASSKDPNPVRRYWQNKKWSGREPFHLTLSDVYVLLYMAGITINDVGRSGYHLARFGDSGPYERGNCRFIPVAENIAERKHGKTFGPRDDAFREKCRQRQLGKKHSTETRRRMSVSQKARRLNE